MKKTLLVCVLLIAMLIPAGCGSSGGGEYVAPEGVELLYVHTVKHIGGGIGIFADPIVHNTGDKAIKNITIAVRAYDKNGIPIDSWGDSKYTELDFESINVVPDAYWGMNDNRVSSVKISSSSNEQNVFYLEGAISAVEYLDGSTWESKALDAWVKQSDETFSVEGRKDEIAQLKDLAESAKDNPYMTLRSYVDEADELDVYFAHSINVENIGDLVIKNFTLKMLLFDENGYPITADSGHYHIANCVVRKIDDNKVLPRLVAGDSGTLRSQESTYDVGTPAYVETIISEIEFQNGDTWTNPNQWAWELYYGDYPGKSW